MNKEVISKIYKQGELHFFWIATRKDGTYYEQFETDVKTGKGKENLFTLIDKEPELFKEFCLVNVEDSKVKFSVDLETGDFMFKGVTIKNNINIKNQQLKCTFWRRKAVTINIADSKQSARYMHYIIGLHTNIDGANIKKEYRIFPDFSVQEVLHKQSRKLYAKARIVK